MDYTFTRSSGYGSLTWITASLHTSFSFALVGAVVGEFVGAIQGIGLMIQNAGANFNANGVFAAMAILVVVALVTEAFICLFMQNSYVSSHQATVQKLVNAYVKTLKWMQTHTAAQIADQMPADYYAGNKALYVTALQNQMAIFSPDGKMPADGPQSVLSIEYQSNLVPRSKQIDLSTTFTNEFVNKAS